MSQEAKLLRVVPNLSKLLTASLPVKHLASDP